MENDREGSSHVGWVVAGIVFLVFAFQVGLYLADRQEKDILKIRFQLEFGQTTHIGNLDSLARKNRELAIWEKMAITARSISEDEAAIRIALADLENDRDPNKIAAAKLVQERAERNKERLARQLDLASRFGQFENTDHTNNYGFLGRMITDDSLMDESKWYDVAKEIQEMKPKP